MKAWAKLAEQNTRMQDIHVTDKSLIWNSDLIETLELDNLMAQANVTNGIGGQSQGKAAAPTRTKDFPDRNDAEWMKHTIAWFDGWGGRGSNSRIAYRPVHEYTLSGTILRISSRKRGCIDSFVFPSLLGRGWGVGVRRFRFLTRRHAPPPSCASPQAGKPFATPLPVRGEGAEAPVPPLFFPPAGLTRRPASCCFGRSKGGWPMTNKLYFGGQISTSCCEHIAPEERSI